MVGLHWWLKLSVQWGGERLSSFPYWVAAQAQGVQRALLYIWSGDKAAQCFSLRWGETSQDNAVSFTLLRLRRGWMLSYNTGMEKQWKVSLFLASFQASSTFSGGRLWGLHHTWPAAAWPQGIISFPSVLALQESLLGSQAQGGCSQHKQHLLPSVTLAWALWEFPSGRGGNPRTAAWTRAHSSWRPRWLHPLLLWQRTVLLLNHLHWYGSAATIAMQKLPLTTVLLSSLTWDQWILWPLLLPLAKLTLGSPRREVACTHCLAWGGARKKMPKACQYQAQEELFFIYCWDIKDRGNIEAALEERAEGLAL